MTFVNPEPLALFADVIAAGEGEVLVPRSTRRSARRPGRRDLLQRCSPGSAGSTSRRSTSRSTRADGALTGYRAVRRAPDGAGAGAQGRVKTTDALDPPATSIFTPDTEFGSRFLVEVVRGCANLCRFCWAGYNYLPVRAFPADRILQLARGGARARQPRRAGVDRALRPPGDRADPRAAARDGLRDQPRVAPPRRPDRADRASCCEQSGERSITIAPETGSDRLRRVINKTVTNDEILDRAELIFASGIENLKLYYMIGLPTETDDDLVAIRDLTLQMRERDAEARAAPGPDRPDRRQREPADSQAGHRLPVAADGRPGGDRPQDQAAARA